LGTGGTTNNVVAPTTAGRYSYTFTTGAGAGTVDLRFGIGCAANESGSIRISNTQLEPVTYQTTPSTYNPTTTAAYYGPRFDYDPVTLAAKGLLIEEQRTNLLLQSQTLDNASWSKGNGTVTADAIASPDGTVDADAFIENTAASVFHFMAQSVAKAASNIQYTVSFYVKDKGRQVGFSFNSGASGVAGRVNPATGTVTATIGVFGTGWTAGSLTMTDAGNGWYRVVIVATSDTSTTAQFQLSLHNGTSATYTGDGVSGAYLWGAQMEAAAFATSYIPTVASQVTRSADVATMTGTNFSSWYNQSEGAFVTAFDMAGGSAALANNRAVLVARESATSSHNIYNGSGQVTGWTVVSGVDQAYLTTGAVAADTVTNIAYAYKANDFAASRNGGTVATDTSGTLPTPTVLGIGSNSAGSLFLSGHIRSIAYYNTRLTNAQLQTLTAPQMNTTLRLDFINGIYEG